METFSHVKRGYNPEEVDAYIQTLEQIIKSYKDKDNAIKNAIISAQVAADNIIKNAQMQALEYRSKVFQQLECVNDAVHAQKEKLRAFQEDYNQMLRKYLLTVDDEDIHAIENRIDDLEKYIASLGLGISDEAEEHDDEQEQ